ncbi:MAG: DUF6429 family protein [Candidatus Eisenbacteria bacterium]|nr:DUF6429 family protein [Candidatus Eisenbacteria bacterium]
MAFPEGCDIEKLGEVALGLLFLTIHGGPSGPRAWKGLDWSVLNLLYEKGWISDPRSKAKSVALTEDGERLAESFFAKHFREGV